MKRRGYLIASAARSAGEGGAAVNPKQPRPTMVASAAFDYLRERGASEQGLNRLQTRLLALPAQWRQWRADETVNRRHRRLSRLASRLRRLSRDLDADPDAAHITLTAVTDERVELLAAKVANRPTIGAVLALLADDLHGTGAKPLHLQGHRLKAKYTYVIGGIAFELLETGRYKRTPNKDIAELASIVLRKKISARP
jgi:hypothetical protein